MLEYMRVHVCFIMVSIVSKVLATSKKTVSKVLATSKKDVTFEPSGRAMWLGEPSI